MKRCARWSSTSPAARCRRAELPDPELDPGRPATCSSRSTPAACAAPTCTSATARCAARGCPVVPGHQIVATVLAAGPDAAHAPGARVGIPWLGWTDGTCRFCTSGRENLCERARFTGLDRRRRLRDARRGRRALRLRAARGLRRPRGRAAAVRGAHRPPRAADDRRRAAPRALRLRRQRAHRLPGRAAPGPARVRLHARRRRGLAGLRARARLRVGRRRAGARARGARRGDHLRPRRRARARPRCARSGAAASSCAPAST